MIAPGCCGPPDDRHANEEETFTFFFEDADHYAHRVDQLLTVYLDMETNKLVGFKIKGIQRIVRTLGRFDFMRTVPDGNGRVKMGFLLIPGMSMANDEQMEHYEELEEATADLELDPEELQLV